MLKGLLIVANPSQCSPQGSTGLHKRVLVDRTALDSPVQLSEFSASFHSQCSECCRWIGTVRVGVSIAMIGVHALAPVGGNIRVSESESNPSEKGEGEQMHAAEDGASADGAEGSTEGAPEATKDMHHLEKALGHVCASIEKTAALWKKHGMGGQVVPRSVCDSLLWGLHSRPAIANRWALRSRSKLSVLDCPSKRR